jgi:hypothetical protein
MQSVGARASAAAGQWLRNRMLTFEPAAATSAGPAPESPDGALLEARRTEAFEIAFAGAGRRLGYSPTLLTAAELLGAAEGWTEGSAAWSEPELALVLQGQPLATLSRIALLSAWVEGAPEVTRVSVVNRVFHTGDAQEREAVLRALPLLPKPDQFLELGVEACRTHVQSVFEAIACENPYGARYFPEAAFNQMVIKCLFTEVPLKRIAGLPVRRNPELQRMATDYESERRAAGRPVPQDIEFAKTLT